MTENHIDSQVSDTTRHVVGQQVQPAQGKSATGRLLLPGLVLILLLAGGGFWYLQQQLLDVRQQFSLQMAQGVSDVRKADEQAAQALGLAQRQGQQLRELQIAIDQARSQLQSLEQALQIATDSGSDLMLLNDVERLVIIAQQQLQLSSNVSNAIIALESAQSQLARANRPSFAALQQALNGDLDRLRAVVNVDFAKRTQQLDRLYALVSEAPLLIQATTNPAVSDSDSAHPVSAGDQPSQGAVSSRPSTSDNFDETQDNATSAQWKQWLQQARRWSSDVAHSVIQDLHGLIQVRRVDDNTALLLSLDQADRLRDDMRLRVVTARLALLMRQPDVWKAELGMLDKQLRTRFDTNAPQVREALSLIDTLGQASVAASLPTLDNSIRAIEAQREAIGASSVNAIITPSTDEDDGNGLKFPDLIGHTLDAEGADDTEQSDSAENSASDANDKQYSEDSNEQTPDTPRQNGVPSETEPEADVTSEHPAEETSGAASNGVETRDTLQTLVSLARSVGAPADNWRLSIGLAPQARG